MATPGMDEGGETPHDETCERKTWKMLYRGIKNINTAGAKKARFAYNQLCADVSEIPCNQQFAFLCTASEFDLERVEYLLDPKNFADPKVQEQKEAAYFQRKMEVQWSLSQTFPSDYDVSEREVMYDSDLPYLQTLFSAFTGSMEPGHEIPQDAKPEDYFPSQGRNAKTQFSIFCMHIRRFSRSQADIWNNFFAPPFELVDVQVKQRQVILDSSLNGEFSRVQEFVKNTAPFSVESNMFPEIRFLFTKNFTGLEHLLVDFDFRMYIGRQLVMARTSKFVHELQYCWSGGVTPDAYPPEFGPYFTLRENGTFFLELSENFWSMFCSSTFDFKGHYDHYLCTHRAPFLSQAIEAQARKFVVYVRHVPHLEAPQPRWVQSWQVEAAKQLKAIIKLQEEEGTKRLAEYSTLKQKLGSVNEKIKVGEKQEEWLETQNKQKAKDLTKKTEQLNKLAKEIETLKTTLETLQTDYETLKAAAESNKKIQRYQRNLKKIKQEKENLCDEYTEEERRVNEIQTQLKKLQSKYAEKERRYEELKHKLPPLENAAALESYQTKNREFREKISTMQHTLNSVLDEQQLEKEKLQQLQIQYSNLESKYRSTRADYEVEKSKAEDERRKNKTFIIRSLRAAGNSFATIESFESFVQDLNIKVKPHSKIENELNKIRSQYRKARAEPQQLHFEPEDDIFEKPNYQSFQPPPKPQYQQNHRNSFGPSQQQFQRKPPMQSQAKPQIFEKSKPFPQQQKNDPARGGWEPERSRSPRSLSIFSDTRSLRF